MSGDEFEFIDWLRQRCPAPDARLAVGIGDDMAVIRRPDGLLLVASDMLLDGVHFDWRQHGPSLVGRKAIACSLSDCAAMAAVPSQAVVSVALNKSVDMADAKRLAEAMIETSEAYGCRIVGGDTTSWSGPTAIDVAMLAELPGRAQPILRSGAKCGDAIYVTGRLGGSILGKHLHFEPRIAEARRLAETGCVRAMIDISDGLAADLGHICRQSGCAAVLDENLLQEVISEDARRVADQSGKTALEHALHDGEDFELIVVGQSRGLEPFCDAGQLLRIGRMEVGHGVWLDRAGERIAVEPRGWRHEFGSDKQDQPGRSDG